MFRLLEDLTRDECRRLASTAVVVWPVGATEQHGPHLPVGTDAFHAQWVARSAAALAGERTDVIVAPTLAIGSSAHHVQFGGTMSAATTSYLSVVLDGVASLLDSGFSRVFVLNGHGGNHELVQLVARDLALRVPGAHVAAGSWWAMAWDQLVAAGAADTGRFPGHAGRFETSLVLAMRPELVVHPLPHRDEPGTTDTRRFGGDQRVEHHGSWSAIDGYGDSPDLADAELGKRWLDIAATVVADAFLAFQRSSGIDIPA